MSCSWPWCHIEGCESCQEMEAKFATNLDVYLETLIAAKAQRRKEIAELAVQIKAIKAGGNASGQPT
jgi:hypothetical protein